MILIVAFAIVCAAALYLLVLGGSALTRPAVARRFLGGHATTQPLHFTELALRILSGAALVVSAPRMAFGAAILGVGWTLVGTSLVLALLPWRLHQRFAAWSVPQALQYLPLIGLASLAGGLGLLIALFLPRAAG